MNTQTHTAIFFFFLLDTLPLQSVKTPTARRVESVTPMGLKKPTPLRPQTFSKGDKTDAEKNQEENSQACPFPSPFSQKVRTHCTTVKPQTGSSKTHKGSQFQWSVNKNNYDKSDYGFDLSQAGVLVNGPTAVAQHRWSPETSGARSDPVLPSCGQKMILSSPPKKVPAAAAKSVYSWTASNIYQMPSLQCVMWGNQHFTGCQMMSKVVATWQCQKENGSNTHKKVYWFLSSLTPDRWGTSYVEILILLKYLKHSNDSKAQNQLSSVNDPFSFLFFFLLSSI